MMLKSSLALALLLTSGADDLVGTKLPPLKMRVPGAWSHTTDNGTHRFSAPSGDAYFLVDTGHTAEAMEPGVCLSKIVASIGGEHWNKLSIGASPAAKRVELVHNDQVNGDVEEATFVGCDGHSTWSLIFRNDLKKHDRYAPLGDKIVSTIEYLKAH